MQNAAPASLNSKMRVDPSRILNTLVNNLNGMVYRCHHDTEWSMLFVSQGCYELTGYHAEEFLAQDGISYEQITHPDDRERVRDEINLAIQGGRRFTVHYRILCKDGQVKWVHESGMCVQDELGIPVIEGFMEDETQSMQMMEALENAEHYYRNLVENISVGIFQTSLEGKYLAANPALARIYGYDTAQELISALSDIGTQLYVEEGRRDEFRYQMQQNGEVANFESEVYRCDGSKIWISENAHVVRDVTGRFICYEGTVHDVTERKHHQALLERQANFDALTGLLNRNMLHKLLDQSIARSERLGYFLAVVFVDLDNFKIINDSLGHAAGDTLLVEVAARLKNCLRSTDIVVRQGGDEFVLVLNDHYRVQSVIGLLKRVLAEVGRPVNLSGREFQVGASLGVAMYPADGGDTMTLLKHADAAMYAAKNKGRNNFQFYTRELNRMADERLNLERAMRLALERDEFEPFFQPKVDAEKRIVGVEALARWDSAEWGMIPPDKFIALAEETGMIAALTDMILGKAFRQVAHWRAQQWPLQLAVNLSPKLFLKGGLPEHLSALARHAGLPQECIELEITENLFLGDDEQALQKLCDLKDAGFQLAMDDFGTGYSSLSYLRRFPLDIIKIDRSLVTGIEHEEEVAKIARAVISLGASLGKTVVAEGVENQAQFDYLRQQGCDEFQGYLFARPLHHEAMSALLLES